MPDRIMFVQLKTGYDTDMGPAWISWVRFSNKWKRATWMGRTLQRRQGDEGNFFDRQTGEFFWISGPHRDQRDTRCSNVKPEISEDVREAYEAFLLGAPLPGREDG
jgi:hypothetical protein